MTRYLIMTPFQAVLTACAVAYDHPELAAELCALVMDATFGRVEPDYRRAFDSAALLLDALRDIGAVCRVRTYARLVGAMDAQRIVCDDAITTECDTTEYN